FSFSSSALSSLISALSFARVSHISLLQSERRVRDVLDTVRCDLPKVPENLCGEPLDLFVSRDMVPLFQYVTPGTEISGDDHRRLDSVRQNGSGSLTGLLALVTLRHQDLDNFAVCTQILVVLDCD